MNNLRKIICVLSCTFICGTEESVMHNLTEIKKGVFQEHKVDFLSNKIYFAMQDIYKWECHAYKFISGACDICVKSNVKDIKTMYETDTSQWSRKSRIGMALGRVFLPIFMLGCVYFGCIQILDNTLNEWLLGILNGVIIIRMLNAYPKYVFQISVYANLISIGMLLNKYNFLPEPSSILSGCLSFLQNLNS